MKRKIAHRSLALLLGMLIAVPLVALADWYEASGKPVARSLLNSADLRTEFASIESDIADKLPALTGNGSKLIAVNSAGTALEALSLGVAVASGGTGATTASGARTNLGLVIGTDVQGFDADLSTLAGLAKTNSNFIVGNGSAWVAESGSTVRSSLGLGSLATASTISNSNWSGTDLALVNGGTGSSTASGARTNLGLGSLAIQSTVNNGDWSGTDLAVTNGGTGSSTAAGARTNLGLAIGTDVQAFDADLLPGGWGQVSAAGGLTASGGVVTGASRVNAGVYDVTFTGIGASYGCAVSPHSSSARYAHIASVGPDTIRVHVRDSSDALTDTIFHIVCSSE